MKASEIRVGLVCRMRYWPILRMGTARVIERRNDGTFVVAPVHVEKEHGEPVAYGPSMFEAVEEVCE